MVLIVATVGWLQCRCQEQAALRNPDVGIGLQEQTYPQLHV